MRTLLLVMTLITMVGCKSLDVGASNPVGFSQDENGRPCATYETKSDRVYKTVCDYRGQYPAPATNAPRE